MTLLHIVILAIVQGLAELLPVSSSAHVVVSEKLMGLDPTSPEMTLLLVMLHTGTMFAVIVYFWKQWMRTYFQSVDAFKRIVILLFVATALTGVIGEGLIKAIEKFAFHGAKNAEVEQLFGRLDLIAPALAAVGVLILIAGIYEKRHPFTGSRDTGGLGMKQGALIGIVQGVLPALPRFLPLGRDDFDRASGGRRESARGSLQLRSRRGAHSRGRRARSAPPHEGRAHQRRTQLGIRDAAESHRHGLRVCRRARGAEVAQQMARKRPLVFVRDLLPGCRRGGWRSAPHGLLTPLDFRFSRCQV